MISFAQLKFGVLRYACMIVISLLVEPKTITAIDCTCDSCLAPLPVLQQIVANGQPVKYIHNSTTAISIPRWCVDGNNALSPKSWGGGMVKFTKNDTEQSLTYTNPSPSDSVNNLPLYLVEQDDNGHCNNPFDAVTIHSDVGNITAKLIVLHVVEESSCPQLPALLNGQITYENVTIPQDNLEILQTANFSCNSGFYLSGGNETRECERNINDNTARWSGIPPICNSIICVREQNPSNGNIEYSHCDMRREITGVLPFASMASCKCDQGFRLARGNKTRSCQRGLNNTGVWSGTPPSCEPITCSRLKVPKNCNITYYNLNDQELENISESLEQGTTANHNCDQAFILSGEIMRRVCQIDGEWSGKELECRAIVCPDLEPPLNGSISFNDDSKILGSVATYSCQDGFDLFSGNSYRTCDYVDKMAKWAGQAPICIQVKDPVTDPVKQLNNTISCSPEIIGAGTSALGVFSLIMGLLGFMIGWKIGRCTTSQLKKQPQDPESYRNHITMDNVAEKEDNDLTNSLKVNGENHHKP